MKKQVIKATIRIALLAVSMLMVFDTGKHAPEQGQSNIETRTSAKSGTTDVLFDSFVALIQLY